MISKTLENGQRCVTWTLGRKCVRVVVSDDKDPAWKDFWDSLYDRLVDEAEYQVSVTGHEKEIDQYFEFRHLTNRFLETYDSNMPREEIWNRVISEYLEGEKLKESDDIWYQGHLFPEETYEFMRFLICQRELWRRSCIRNLKEMFRIDPNQDIPKLEELVDMEHLLDVYYEFLDDHYWDVSENDAWKGILVDNLDAHQIEKILEVVKGEE